MAVHLCKHLNQTDLARRWGISPRTLERWRWLDEGPPYIKVGRHVVYSMADIELFEQRYRRAGSL